MTIILKKSQMSKLAIFSVFLSLSMSSSSISAFNSKGGEGSTPLFLEPAIIKRLEASGVSQFNFFDVENILNYSNSDIIVGSRPGEAECIDFGHQALSFGNVDDNLFRDQLPGFRSLTGGHNLAVEVDGNKSMLRHKYVPSPVGSDRVVMRANIDPQQKYRITQKIFFEPDFEWGSEVKQGGKLGFGFGGGTRPSGGIVDPAGFTIRLMWRGNYVDGSFDGNARLFLYSYAADRPGHTGENYSLESFEVPIGEWMNVVFEVQMNSSIHVSDGSLRAWINGELMLDQGSIGWQLAGDQPIIDTLYYSSFYGGSNPDWAPGKTTYTRVKDVCWSAVIDQFSGIDPDVGRFELNSPQHLLVENVLDEGLGVNLEVLGIHDQIAQAMIPAEDAILILDSMQRGASGAAILHYSNAVSAISDALSVGRAVLDSSLGLNPIGNLSNAYEELESAVSLNTVGEIELLEAENVREKIAQTMLAFSNIAVSVGEQNVSDLGCNETTTDDHRCVAAYSFQDEARLARDTALITENRTMENLSWYFELAWFYSVESINALQRYAD